MHEARVTMGADDYRKLHEFFVRRLAKLSKDSELVSKNSKYSCVLRTREILKASRPTSASSKTGKQAATISTCWQSL